MHVKYGKDTNDSWWNIHVFLCVNNISANDRTEENKIVTNFNMVELNIDDLENDIFV